MLTDSQLTQFEVFGFLVLRGLLTPEETDKAGADFDLGLARATDGMERGGIRGQLNWSNLGPETPFLASLLEDERFYGAAQQILGKDAVGYSSNANSFDGDRTEWHPDVGDLDWHGIKFGFYLQPLDRDSGALRLIPGSQRSPFHDELFAMGLKGDESPYLKKARLSINDVPAYVWESEPTDMIAFNNRTWHASWGGSGDRRQVNVSYFKNASDAYEEDLSQKFSHLTKTLRPDHDQHQSPYPPDWLANRHNNPTVQHWVDWLKKYGHLE